MITVLPGVEYASMPRAGYVTGALTWPPRLAVIHHTGNPSSSRYDEAHYASTRTDPQNRWTSAHCYVDHGGVLGSLPLTLRAWSAKAYGNTYGFHIEICLRDIGNADALGWAAWVTMRLCQEAGIPMVKLTPSQLKAGSRGIVGHRDFTVAGIDNNDHNDPDDAGFDWPGFMARVTGGLQLAGEDEDTMGASFGPIEILREGETSLTIPPVQAGAADKRAAWLNLGNAGDGRQYALRVWRSNGTGAVPFRPDASWDSEGRRVFNSAQRYSWELPAGTAALYISRKGITGAGGACEPVILVDGQPQPNPAMATAPSTSHLTLCIERGPVLP